MAIIKTNDFQVLTISAAGDIANTANNWTQIQKSPLGVMEVDTTFGLVNNRCLKTTLNYTEEYNSNFRCELRGVSGTSLFEQWVAFNIFIDDTWQPDSLNCVIHQQHGGAPLGGGSPTISLRVENDDLYFQVISGQQSVSEVRTRFNIGKIKVNQWMQFHYKVRFSPDSNGLFRCWYDGTNVGNRINLPVGYDGLIVPPTSHKIGQYHSTRSLENAPVFTTRTIWYDEYRIANFADSDWDTFIALDALGRQPLTGIEPPTPPPPPESIRARLRMPEPIV